MKPKWEVRIEILETPAAPVPTPGPICYSCRALSATQVTRWGYELCDECYAERPESMR